MSLQEIAVKPAAAVVIAVIATSMILGCIDSPGDGVNVITIGSTDADGHVSDFSGSGPTRDGRTKPTAVAPGENIISTVPPGLSHLSYIGVYYARQSGTSLSTPVAAGVAALLLQADRNLTPAGVKAAMTRGAVRLNSTQGEEYEEYFQGAGLINANRSHALIGGDLCGVMPTRWNAGKWAFRSGGRAISPGLDIGADRPVKKIYALAPLDQDWTTKFTFFTDKEKRNVTSRVTGAVANWTNLQPLSKVIPANGQEVFGATVTIPEGTPPGVYNGSIDILSEEHVILTIPVRAQVAEPLEVDMGMGSAKGVIGPGEWRYYYMDVPLGTAEVSSSLDWNDDASMDLFLLAPTSEYYAGDRDSLSTDVDIRTPPSGRWLLAVHAREMEGPTDYTVTVKRSTTDSSPRRWNAGFLRPGEIATARFAINNQGTDLEDVTYEGVLENNSTRSFGGAVEDKRRVNRDIDVPQGSRSIGATLRWRNEENDLALRLYDPSGDLADSSDGYENIEEVYIKDPDPGRWRVEVYGYSVSSGREQTFDLDLTTFLNEKWSWISVDGPGSIPGSSTTDITASMAVPEDVESKEYRGLISIRAGNGSMEIPVTATVSGARVSGLVSWDGDDTDSDGYLNDISITIGMNASAPEFYRIEGGLLDCSGEMIEWLSGDGTVVGNGSISLLANGSDIWRGGRCGPMSIEELFIYNRHGEIVGRYDERITIDLDPKDFQPPSAYLNGTVQDASTPRRISLAVGVTVIHPGRYGISGRIEDDEGEELGEDSVEENLEAGNATLVLEFNPTKFIMLGRPSRIYLTDLSLALDGREIEHVDEAWESESEIDPGNFGLQSGGYTPLGRNRGSGRSA